VSGLPDGRGPTACLNSGSVRRPEYARLTGVDQRFIKTSPLICSLLDKYSGCRGSSMAPFPILEDRNMRRLNHVLAKAGATLLLSSGICFASFGTSSLATGAPQSPSPRRESLLFGEVEHGARFSRQRPRPRSGHVHGWKLVPCISRFAVDVPRVGEEATRPRGCQGRPDFLRHYAARPLHRCHSVRTADVGQFLDRCAARQTLGGRLHDGSAGATSAAQRPLY